VAINQIPVFSVIVFRKLFLDDHFQNTIFKKTIDGKSFAENQGAYKLLGSLNVGIVQRLNFFKML